MNHDNEDKLNFDPDFINSHRYNDSLKELLEKNPNGVSDKVIGQVIDMPEKDVSDFIVDILAKLKKMMGVDEER